jgi:hypothetical protein
MHTISISLFRSIWSPTEFPLRRLSPLATTQHSPSKRSFRFESSSPSPRLPLPYADEAPSPPLEIRYRAAGLDFSKGLEVPRFKSITVRQAPPGLLHLVSDSAARSVHGRARSPSPTFTAWSLEPGSSTSWTSSAPTALFESGFHVLCVLVCVWGGGGGGGFVCAWGGRGRNLRPPNTT